MVRFQVRPRALRAAAVVLIFCVAVAALLWRPLSSFSTHTFASTDLVTRGCDLTRPASPAGPRSNSILSDPPTQMHPWVQYNAARLSEGELPLWNPYNGLGRPHMANYQSAVFSPFSALYYALGWKRGLVADAALRLFLTMLGVFHLARALGLARAPALVAGVLCACSGLPLLYLQYPHSAVFLCLPFALAAMTRLEQALRAGRRSRGATLLLGASAGCALLAGHPETLLWVTLTCAAYSAWLLALGRAPRGSLLIALTGPALVGLAVGAIQVLPFLEYLLRSNVIAVRHTAMSLHVENWPLAIFPDLAGTPVGDRLLDPRLPRGNYEEINSFRVGAVALLCWLSAPFAAWRRHLRPFAGLAAIVIAYAYDLGGLASWLHAHTPLAHVPVLRSQPPWTLGLCLSAAAALHAHLGAPPGWRRAGQVLAAACGLAVLSWIGASRYLEQIAAELGRDPSELWGLAGPHLREIASGLLLGVVGLVLLAGARVGAWRRLGLALVAVAAFLEAGRVHARYTPCVEDFLAYPRTAALEQFVETVADSRVVFMTPDRITADTNMLVGVRMAASFDGMELETTQRVLKALLGMERSNAAPTLASRRALEVLGIRYVTDDRNRHFAYERAYPQGLLPKLDVPGELRRLAADPSAPGPFVTLSTDPPRRQRFVAPHSDLDGVRFHVVRDPERLDARIRTTVTDPTSRRELASFESAIGALNVPQEGRADVWIPFEAQPDSRGKPYLLTISASPGKSGADVLALAVPRREGSVSDRVPPLALDLTFGRGDFELVERIGRRSIQRYKPSRGRAWWVGRALRTSSEEDALERLTEVDFRPYEEVVLFDPSLERGASTNGDSESPRAIDGVGGESSRAIVERLEEHPNTWRFRVSAPTPGWLVLAQSHFPGWKAYVDGREGELLRANYAFSAVALPAGEHEVRFEYRPASVTVGAAFSALGIVVTLLWGALGLRAPRRGAARAAS